MGRSLLIISWIWINRKWRDGKLESKGRRKIYFGNAYTAQSVQVILNLGDKSKQCFCGNNKFHSGTLAFSLKILYWFNSPFKNAHLAPDVFTCLCVSSLSPLHREAKGETRDVNYLPQCGTYLEQNYNWILGILNQCLPLNMHMNQVEIWEYAHPGPLLRWGLGVCMSNRVPMGLRLPVCSPPLKYPNSTRAAHGRSLRKHKILSAIFFITVSNFSYSQFSHPTKEV